MSKTALWALITTIALLIFQYFTWLYAPVDINSGEIQRIFYMHLPVAWWGLISFFGAFVCSIFVLWKKNNKMDYLAASFVEIGLLFCTLTLITGSIWGKGAWGVWWTWDPKLTSALILWFIYSAYVALRAIDMPKSKQKTVCAVLGIFAFLDVPLVFFAARMWRSVHPTVFTAHGAQMPSEMLITVLVGVVAWGFLFCFLIWLRYQSMMMNERILLCFTKMSEGQK